MRKFFALIATFLGILCITPASYAGGIVGGYGGDGNNLDLTQLEFGDVILTKEAIANTQYLIPGYWDHAAIYIGNSQLIEAWGEGVRVMPVDVTLSASAAAIYRVNTTAAVKLAAVNFAKSQLGKPYDISYAFWPGSKSVKSAFWYCSELVWAAYYLKGVDLDATPGYSWTYWNNIAPSEIADDDDTDFITFSE